MVQHSRSQPPPPPSVLLFQTPFYFLNFNFLQSLNIFTTYNVLSKSNTWKKILTSSVRCLIFLDFRLMLKTSEVYIAFSSGKVWKVNDLQCARAKREKKLYHLQFHQELDIVQEVEIYNFFSLFTKGHKLGVSKIFAKGATCGEMNICEDCPFHRNKKSREVFLQLPMQWVNMWLNKQQNIELRNPSRQHRQKMANFEGLI